MSIMFVGDYMDYYLNVLYVFSLLGFILESTVYKISNSKRHSGIFYGPITMVYGFGMLTLVLIKKYFLDKIHCQKYLKIIIIFLVSWISLTFIEWLGGSILYQVFHINMWNYSKKAYHAGKYICLDLSIIWELFGTIYVIYLKSKLDKFIELIPKKVTLGIVIINIIDILLVLFNKLS